MFRDNQIKSLGIATALIVLNIGVMWAFAFTPLAGINDLVFGTFFLLGPLLYGALLTGGTWIARRAVRNGDEAKAAAGTGLVQLGFGMFGAGIIGYLGSGLQAVALGITGVATTGIAVLSGLLVYGTGHDFSSWGRYSNYFFLGVLGLSLVGSFAHEVILLAFLLSVAGFVTYLIHEIYVTRERPGTPLLNGIGLYVAFMGVFVHVLQLVVEMLIERE
ncbi:MAG: hypothetical protein ABEJ03_02365 [Candidatus Nanohaloarchaea archaeon]